MTDDIKDIAFSFRGDRTERPSETIYGSFNDYQNDVQDYISPTSKVASPKNKFLCKNGHIYVEKNK